MKKIIRRKTLKIRHLIVKLIAPQLWQKVITFPRPMIEVVKERFGDKEITGIEIGVELGKNAKSMLSLLNIRKLYLIDPYKSYLIPEHKEGEGFYDMIDRLPQAKRLLAKFNQKIVFIIKESSKAVVDIPNKVNFVYIDGDHRYSFVKDDINYYYDKVKSGGIIGGHDFNSSGCLGVCKAVLEFVQRRNLKLNLRKSDWWIIKP